MVEIHILIDIYYFLQGAHSIWTYICCKDSEKLESILCQEDHPGQDPG